jgi:hypothetical protein
MDEKNEELVRKLVEHRNVLHLIETNLRNDVSAMNMFGQARDGQRDEVAAQLTLAFRHCEDARMRVGKALQHLGDGDSIFDDKPVPADEKENVKVGRQKNRSASVKRK